LDKESVEKELMDIEEFNFYLDHVHSALEYVLFSDFFEFYKNMIYNQSLKDFIKAFLSSIQKQGIPESITTLSSKKESIRSFNQNRFKEILAIVLKLFWRLVSSNAKASIREGDLTQFSENYSNVEVLVIFVLALCFFVILLSWFVST